MSIGADQFLRLFKGANELRQRSGCHGSKRYSGRAIIIGASLAGLFAATLLRKAGWHAEVFERSDVELVGRGAGITTHPELLQSLVRSGADLNDLGVVVHERIALDAGGRVVERLPYEQIVTSWDRLYQITRATIPNGTSSGLQPDGHRTRP
jgi:2-polyprenyl-6-methoxyphenol hydroxylase-like FAD-dependent oxidoreductase